jgi:hypothetical protein
MVAAGMRDARGLLAVPALCALALATAGCGGTRQDANAPSGDFRVEVTRASFPARQAVAQATTLKLLVANRGDRAVPDLAVTVETEPGQGGRAPVAFGRSSGDPTLADSSRPVWILDRGPAGGDSAYTNTWAVGPIAKGQTRVVEFKLTAVQAGRFTVAWRLAPALEGDVRLTGARTHGRFGVVISDKPVPAHVGDGGEVIRGEAAGQN